MPPMPEQMNGMYGQYPMTRESSGTSWQPDSTPMQGLHSAHQEWTVMMDGYVNAIYDKQTGKRGDEKSFSTSMFMLMGQRPALSGTLGLRSMFSLDPLMGKDGYPLLLQTGETADGNTPLIDRQHPHDFVMELAATYSKPVSEDSSVFFYFGLPGEPALGPPAFMHRLSGMDNPEAPLTHHWLDSTHITYGVGTFGLIWKKLKIEGSFFNGREPDQHRWDIESPEFNSGSARVSFNPAPNWALQASFGYLHSPEQLEPGTDVRRTTVSIMYNKAFKHGNWQSTFAWGRNDSMPGVVLDGFLLESELQLKKTHTFFTRLERVAKNELFLEGSPYYDETLIVNKVNLGYIYDLPAWNHMRWGIGASLDINIITDRLKPTYGDNPLGYMIFVRVKMD